VVAVAHGDDDEDDKEHHDDNDDGGDGDGDDDDDADDEMVMLMLMLVIVMVMVIIIMMMMRIGSCGFRVFETCRSSPPLWLCSQGWETFFQDCGADRPAAKRRFGANSRSFKALDLLETDETQVVAGCYRSQMFEPPYKNITILFM
jgi:hypothetical protein